MMNEEMITKAKEARSVEELITLAFAIISSFIIVIILL